MVTKTDRKIFCQGYLEARAPPVTPVNTGGPNTLGVGVVVSRVRSTCRMELSVTVSQGESPDHPDHRWRDFTCRVVGHISAICDTIKISTKYPRVQPGE